MHFLLVGPGALGCLLSSIVNNGLAVTGDRLTLLDYNADRAEYLTRQGIVYQQGDTGKTVSVTATSDPKHLEHVDVILLCVKSYDVAASLAFCGPLLTETTLVVFLQNGISHLSMHDHLGRAAAAFGTTTEGATLLGRGHVRHAGSGVTYLGFLDSPNDHSAFLLKKTQTLFATGGLQVETTGSILARIWAKLFINVGINALTATLACKNGQLLTLPGVDERMQTAVNEAMLVARAEGVEAMDDPYLATRIVCSKTSENVSSMLQDVRNRRRTEIEAINGAIVAKGLNYGIKTPENSRLCRQVKDIEAGYTVP
ncbi:MAG: 2-dehydropantoate 2-reductase [Proteobacteria bacterium]|nr:2-dehydropantoate 2-reductase [Pseudomonadota bacterium]